MAADPPAARRRAVLGWTLYDLANTVFFLLVVTLYLPRQLHELTGIESAVAWSNVPTMLVAAFLSPALGALIDRAGHARGLTFALTIVCCSATALLGVPRSAVAVSLLYAAARFTYEMASVPYNALLPSIGTSGVGRVSGLGVALGYLGNVLALALLRALDLERHGYVAVYAFAAGLFLLFTLPLRLWVREPPPARPAPFSGRDAWRAVASTFQSMRRQLSHPQRRRYFLGMLLVCDVLNTVLMQLARYAQRNEGLGLSDDGVKTFLMVVQFAAIGGGLVLGRLADRFTGRRITLVSVVLVTLGVAMTQFLPGFWLRATAMGVLGGAGLAGVWAAGRLWLVQLVPPQEIGEAFGFYGLVQRASVLTLLPFTFLFDRTGSYATSVVVLLAVLVAGFSLLHRTASRDA